MSVGPETSLQFDRAEIDSAASPAASCSQCKEQIVSIYYEASGNLLCERCQMQRTAPVTGVGAGRFARALLAGSGAAIAGALLYYGVSALTGYQFGLIAIVVGFAVGKAVRWGSNNRGGRRYQAIAIALTYLSIVGTYVPYVFKGLVEASKEESSVASTAKPSQPPAATEASAAEGGTAGQVFIAVAIFAGIVLIAPFLAGFENVIGLLIIAFGLFEAWKINRKVEEVINGPFRLGDQAAAPPSV